MAVDSVIKEKFGDRVRVRACGLCWRNDQLLMVNHFGMYGHDLWAPPGGGVDLGIPATEVIIREFKEETGLVVAVGDLKFVCEFISSPFHAVELFFEVHETGGHLITGIDPEMEGKEIIKAVKFMEVLELLSLPEKHRHGLFKGLKSQTAVKHLQGYLPI